MIQKTMQINTWLCIPSKVLGDQQVLLITQLDAEFQGIAKRDKKDFLNEQHKEIEENKRMEKTRDSF